MDIPKPPVENFKSPKKGMPKPAPFRLADSRWRQIAIWLPRRRKTPRLKRKRKGGRPRHDDRRCFEGMLWLLWNGAVWCELPRRYGTKSTIHRRITEWEKYGTLDRLWLAYLKRLGDKKIIFWKERLKRKKTAWPFGSLEGAMRANYARLCARPAPEAEAASFNSR